MSYLRHIFSILFILLFISVICYGASESKSNERLFLENKGQWNRSIEYLAQMPGMNVIISGNKIIYDVYKNSGSTVEGQVISMEFAGSSRELIINASEASPGVYNFIKGNDTREWVFGVKAYNEISLRNIYKNIDAVLKFDAGLPRYDFIVKPGAEISDIGFTFKGANNFSLNQDNILLISTNLGVMSHAGIYAYQKINGVERQVKCSFKQNSDGSIGFSVGAYKKDIPLVIDPTIFSAYLGSTAEDVITDIASSPNNDFAVCGWTLSSDFNISVGAYSTNYINDKDIFVAKYRINGISKELVFSTVIGGGASEEAKGIDIDVNGNLVISGYTNSSDFPSKGGFGYGYNKENDAFLLMLPGAGDTLNFSTCFGGSKDDQATDVKLAPDGTIYVVGFTNSTNFPLQSAHQSKLNGLYDIFISKINKSGKSLDISTYYGGATEDKAYALDVDNQGNAYLTGSTGSGDFPITPFSGWGPNIWQKPYDHTYNGGLDAFVIKMGNGGKIEYATYFGGSADDIGKAVSADDDGTVFFAGTTQKEAGTKNFPVSENAYQSDNKGGNDCFLAKLNKLKVSGGPWSTISQDIAFSTFFGQSGEDIVNGLVYNKNNNSLFVTGYTSSSKYPEVDETMLSIRGKSDAFISEFSSTGSEMNFSKIIGGNNEDCGTGIDIDNRGDLLVAGWTKSNDFPQLYNNFQTAYGGGTSDGFVLKYAFGSVTITTPIASDEFCPGSTLPVKWNYTRINAIDKFNVYLKNSEGELLKIGSEVSGSSFDWKVPADFEKGSHRVFVSHYSGLMDSSESSIVILSPPVLESITYSPESLTLCEGEKLSFTASASGKDLVYNWKHNGVTVQSGSESALTINSIGLDQAGSYELSISGFCTPAAGSQKYQVDVKPATEILNNFNDTTVRVGETVSFEVEAKGLNLIYQWYLNDVKLTGKNEPVIILEDVQIGNQGVYQVTVTGDCGADNSNEFTVTVDTTTGIDNEIINGLKVNASYIPGENNVKVSISSDFDLDAAVSLSDNNGRQVGIAQNWQLFTGNNEFYIDAASLSAGVYWLNLQNKDFKSAYKISVLK